MAATSQLGLGLELDVIASVVVGGTPLTGGRGSIANTFLGVLIVTLLSNGMNMAGGRPLPPEHHQGRRAHHRRLHQYRPQENRRHQVAAIRRASNHGFSRKQGKYRDGIPPTWPLRPACLRRDPRHHDIRGQRQVPVCRQQRPVRGHSHGRRRAGRRCQPSRYLGPVLDGNRRGDGGRGDQGKARTGPAGDQGAVSDGARPERHRAVAPPPDECLRREPEAAGGRPHRPVSAPRLGWLHPDRGDHGGAGVSRRLGQGPLYRRVEFHRLAAHESARGRRPGRQRALRQPADPLHPGRAGG